MAPKRKALRSSPKATEKATVWVPESFLFEKIFDQKDVTPTVRVAFKNTAYFVLHALSRHKFSLYELEKLEETGYLNLSAALLKKICGNSYKIVLEALKRAEVIEESPNGYQTGVRSKGYKLHSSMEKSALIPKELAGRVRERYQQHSAEQEKASRDSLAPLAHLTKWFDSPDLTINVEKAHDFIELANVKIKMMIAGSTLSADVKAALEGRVALRLSYQINSVKAFAAGDFRLSNRGRDERLHSILTSMKRELRSFIQYQGQNLVSLDIRSSQPYLFTMVLRKSFFSASVKNPLSWKALVAGFKPKAVASSPTPSSTPVPDPAYLPAPELLSIMFPGVTHLSEKQIVDRTRFLKISWTDGIYGILADELRASGAKINSVESMKKLVMWLFFEHGKYKYNDARFKAFADLYPVEAGVIRGISSIQPKLLPVLLQRLESRIMLQMVTKSMSEKVSEAVLLAVHDCVLTTPDSATQIEAVMREELARITGIAPGIKVEQKSSDAELDALDSFSRTIFEDSLEAVQKSKMKLDYADYKLVPPLLNAPASHGKLSTKFNPFFYGRYEVPSNGSF